MPAIHPSSVILHPFPVYLWPIATTMAIRKKATAILRVSWFNCSSRPALPLNDDVVVDPIWP